MKDLIIINNEKVFEENKNFYCENLDLKILPEELNNYYKQIGKAFTVFSQTVACDSSMPGELNNFQV